MICTYHYIRCVDLNSDGIFRLYSKNFVTDTVDFKAFFRSRQEDLEACSVELQNGDIYFWSRYNTDNEKENGWFYVGKVSVCGRITMRSTKMLLASRLPDSILHLDLSLGTEYSAENYDSVSLTYRQK